jgi:excinuclease ABC subunit B
VSKRVKDIIEGVYDAGEAQSRSRAAQARKAYEAMGEKDLTRELKRVEKEMLEAARRLEFERAAELRNRLAQLKRRLFIEEQP